MQSGWKELGRVLKGLRMAQDLGQKEVIDRMGEEMGERTLRGYESGEQRPSRDRLLRLLTRSFQLHSIGDVNRFLQLAKYAHLTSAEIQQSGLVAPTADQNGHAALSISGPPADFRIEVSTLVVVDGQGREVWRHQFPMRLAQTAYGDRNLVKRCTFADLDGDGRIETLFVYVPLDFVSQGQTLICFSEQGEVKWEFVPGRTVKDSTGREYVPPYFISNVDIVPFSRSNPRIVVSSNHYVHNPNQVAMLDINGELVSEYWHSGHLLSVGHADMNNDGVEEILLAGVNNGYRQATMVAFDSRNVSGVSSQPGRQILGFTPGTEKAIILFPRTCVSKDASYNRVMELHVTRERRIMLAVAEGISEAKNPGVMIYELDFNLNVINARPDSHLQEAHRALELEGVLDHSWTEEENEQLRQQVIINRHL
jgi:transcriptional regulator with XRE-family HTH domain